ncbi:hypothetical protein [Aquimarina brevivitae]|uniref:Uncharacterized protein n=1 Tax=Aquimarina brevivitae TaxID=323412 RepID=A0A4Q7PGH6_9FLAO|nr:hypothetical protein [Aquimarina brevivitae]RZS99614.1 hypothetical protein EV197_0837 [Aquimarina brevivitae]
MKTEYTILKKANLNNNCPVCFNTDGLIISFKQKELKTALFKRNAKDVEDKIECLKCKSHIYPALWTKDIEMVYDYHRKTVTPTASKVRFTPLFYTLVIILFIIVAATIIYLKNPEILNS